MSDITCNPNSGEEQEETSDNDTFSLTRTELRQGLYNLSLEKSYAPDWTTRDAFREFVQNWFVGFL